MYNKKVIDYFSNPRNMGEIKDADAVAQGGNPVCGDVVKLYLKIQDNKIADIKFKAFGCGACLASTSALTEIIKGKTLEEAKKITNQDVADFLGGIPAEKMICSNFSTDVLKKALEEL
ncbi:MAG: iron-sulfur cluster assembly scaffold protein [Patescibacteria group bacterium]|jgi:nitrogen fixation NifU-like protein